MDPASVVVWWCVCVWFWSILCSFCSSTGSMLCFFVFFAREIWRAIYRPALSMCFPPFLSFTLSSFPPRFMMLLDSPSSSHTFLPLNSRFFFSSVVVLSSYSVSSALFLCVVPRCFRTIVPPSFPVDFCLWIINGCWMAVTGSNAKIQSSYGG